MRIGIKEARKALVIVVGTAQSTVGVLTATAACILYSDFLGLGASLNVPELLPIYVLILIVFGFFSILSGLFLLTEIEKSP
jgi:hypothetical protein